MRGRDEWDEGEFAALFDGTYPGLSRYLECMLGRGGAAQEVAQEAFLRLLRLGPGRVARGEERFWLYRVATNLARNEIRRAGVRARLAGAVGRLFAPRRADPHADAELAGEGARLAAALGRLPADRRAAFLLREQEGLGYAEIAEALGVSLAKVKADIHRARRALRAELCAAGEAGAVDGESPRGGRGAGSI